MFGGEEESEASLSSAALTESGGGGRGWSDRRTGSRGGCGYAEGLFFPVGERAPEPLERTEAEVTKPDRADDEDHKPDSGDNVVELVALKFVEEAEAVAFEDRGADERR